MTPRIVSLLPSATEIVCALGLGDQLVGRSHECDFPRGIESLPICTEPKIRPGRTSHEIHVNVMEVLRDEASVYRVHAALLRVLQPTHVVTQIQCEVCAVSLKDVEAALSDWSDEPPRILALNPRSLADVYDDILRTANALGRPDEGRAVVESMKTTFEQIAAKTASIEPKPRVATIEWIDPLMAAGNWMPELVAIAGGINLFGAAGQHSPWLSFEELIAADPDVIIVMPCGFTPEQSIRDLPILERRPEWRDLRAVRTGQVFVTDGNQYFNRPGPRLADSARILAEILETWKKPVLV